jgi:SAM-dependent methyltransferase
MNIAKVVAHRFGRWYIQRICRQEYEAQQYRWTNERPVEYRFAFEQLTRTWPQSVLDVGTGTTALPHLMRTCGFVVTAIDNIKDYWPEGMLNRHYYVIQDDITATTMNQEFDFITCISVLEHIKNHQQAVDSMFRLLKPRGHLLLTVPYSETRYLPNVYELPEAGYGKEEPYVCQAYSRRELNEWIEAGRARVVTQEYWQFFTGEFWTVGERLSPPKRVDRDELHQWTGILFQKQ